LPTAGGLLEQQGLSAHVVAAFYRGLEAGTARRIERRFLESARAHAGGGNVSYLLSPKLRRVGDQHRKAAGRMEKGAKRPPLRRRRRPPQRESGDYRSEAVHRLPKTTK